MAWSRDRVVGPRTFGRLRPRDWRADGEQPDAGVRAYGRRRIGGRQIWKAAAFAAHYNLDNLTVIADINRLGQSEPTMYKHDMERYRLKFESEGFDTQVIDGHDVAAVLAALDRAKTVKGRPQAIVARTIKGHGFSLVADKPNWHGKAFSKEQLAAAIQEMGGGPTVPPDPGKSFARASLPKPPEFPPPAAPTTQRCEVRNPRSVRIRAEAAGRGESSDSGHIR